MYGFKSVLPFTCFMTFGKAINPSMPQFPHMQNKAKNSSYFIGSFYLIFVIIGVILVCKIVLVSSRFAQLHKTSSAHCIGSFYRSFSQCL